MIDTDKMKIAFAATPLCRHKWTERGDGGSATKLCAVSALVSFAGVQPELIAKMDETSPGGAWVHILATPVLRAEYGIPYYCVSPIVSAFDHAENEWRGVVRVLEMCEQWNMAERHEEAITEDAARFPQYGPATSDRRGMTYLTMENVYGDTVAYMYKNTWSTMLMDWNAPTTQVVKKAPKKVLESAPLPMLVAKTSDFLAIGESALDEYWKVSGTAPPLWTANVMPGIAKEFGMPTLIHEPTLTEMKKLAVP